MQGTVCGTTRSRWGRDDITITSRYHRGCCYFNCFLRLFGCSLLVPSLRSNSCCIMNSFFWASTVYIGSSQSFQLQSIQEILCPKNCLMLCPWRPTKKQCSPIHFWVENQFTMNLDYKKKQTGFAEPLWLRVIHKIFWFIFKIRSSQENRDW